MSNNNLFKVPFGFYVENNQLISKRTQIEQLLDGINEDAEMNAQLDAEQGEKIAANTEAINKEVERSSSLDSQFESALEQEISDRKKMGGILNTKISDLEESIKSLVEETDSAFDVVAEELRKKDEMLDAKDTELTNSISVLSNNLSSETTARKNADETLSQAIKGNLDQIDELNELINSLDGNLTSKVDELEVKVNEHETSISNLSSALATETSNRESADTVLTEKVNTIVSSVKDVYDYAKTKDNELATAIEAEKTRALEVEANKVDWTDLGNNRKAIVLKNHDLLLGTGTNGTTYNVGMISKWDIVDLGTTSLPINLNTPKNVRPTVQEEGQTGEQAHKIAYLSDIDNISSSLNESIKVEKERAEAAEQNLTNSIVAEETRAKAAEKSLDEKIDNSVISLNSSIGNMNSTLAILSSTDTALNTRIDVVSSTVNNLKGGGIIIQATSDLQYTLFVDGVNRGTIDIPKDNFLKDVYLAEGDKLHFVFSVEDKQSDIEVDISKYIDIYTAGNGLSVNNNKFSIVISNDSEGYLTVSENGLKLSGVKESIDAAVLVEETRAKDVENTLNENLSLEIQRSTSKDETLKQAIITEESRAISAETALSKRLVVVEGFETSILTNKSNIVNLTDRITIEEVRAQNAENNLQTTINGVSNRVTANENNITSLSNSILSEKTVREEKDAELANNINTLSTNLTNESNRAKSAEQANATAIEAEKTRALEVEANKVDWTDLGNNRKAITLANNDLLLGTTSKGVTVNIGMVSKLDIVDLGTNSLPINLNTPKDVRPTIQEFGQTGEQAHKIAYLSDVDAVDAKVNAISFDGYATEQWVEDKGYLQAVPDNFITEDELTIALEDKVTVVALNKAIDGVKAEIPTKVSSLENDANYLIEHQSLDGYATEQWVEEKGYLTEHQDLSEYAKVSEINELRALIVELQNKVKELDGRVYDANHLVELLSSIKEGETLDIKLYNDLVISEENRMTVPVGATLNLNLNGKTIFGNFDDILFRVNGTLNIDGDGVVSGSAYAASVNSTGVVNVLNGKFDNEVTSFQANGGIINIEDGYFNIYGETYGSTYMLNHIDAKKNDGLISVKGGVFVNYNPEESNSENPPMNFVADGYGAVKTIENGKTLYKVVPANKVESTDNFANLMNSLTTDTETLVKLNSDVVVNDGEKITFEGNVVLDLNGKTITFNSEDILFRVNGTLTIYGGNINSNGYAASVNQGGTLNIIDGTYNCVVTAVQSNGGIININGGDFSACDETYGCKYTLNFIDSMKEVGQINVMGGTFVGFDPSNSESETPAMNFVADGYKSVESVKNGVTIYTVIKE